MSAAIPPPPPPLEVFHIEALSSALTKLGITVPTQVTTDAVEDEERKRFATPSASAETRRAALLERMSKSTGL